MAAKGEHLNSASEIGQRARDLGKAEALAFAEQRHRGGPKAAEFADDIDANIDEYSAAGLERDVARSVTQMLRQDLANATARHRGTEYLVPSVTGKHVQLGQDRIWKALRFGYLLSLADTSVVPTPRLVLVADVTAESVAAQYPQHARAGEAFWISLAPSAELLLPGATVVWDSSTEQRLRARVK